LYNRNSGVISAGITLALFFAFTGNVYAQGTGGTEAPPQLNPNVTITVDVMEEGLIGSVATMYDGTTFVDCDNCGEIVTIFHGKKTYFKLRMTKTEQFVWGTYVYQQLDRHGKFAWRGKSLVANDWNGKKLKGKKTIRIDGRKITMGLVSAMAQVHDATKPELPVKNGICDPRVMICNK
jgi:hypothetical protein